eukprot:TRINITY_DN11975_c0_g1_i1.p1 TRINITY_DN11975_c0_g1~~TRINITY_DN11975_c0_g1_i1.p1  ORF type:complete len:255 (-),score=37.06 TRINITY_DN11975_c0_g1_i1:95-859(-)
MCIRDSPLSNGPELVAEQLQQIAAWSHQYPGTTKHEPVWVSLDVKGLYHSCCCGSKLPRGGWHESDAADPAECESAMWAAERMIQGFFGDKAVSVQDLRRGCHSVRAGLQASGWPSIQELRGRFFFTSACVPGPSNPESVILVKSRWRQESPGQEPDACFYEAREVKVAREIVEAGFICRACLLIHDGDHEQDGDQFNKLRNVGVQYIATNCLQTVLEMNLVQNPVVQTSPLMYGTLTSGSVSEVLEVDRVDLV